MIDQLAGWGRYPRAASTIVDPATLGELAALHPRSDGLIARGNGRAYGDAAIGRQTTLRMAAFDRMRAFDPATGRLTVEAGVLLADIISAFLPRGYFPPVVPGTEFVTVGGMIAADVHGKNHHRVGGFGSHIEALTLILPSGEAVACSPDREPELLRATIGGMGLTGTIVEATFRLMPVETGWVRQSTIVAHDLDAVLSALSMTEEATYSVAWIDCLAKGAALGRSLVYLGEHASRAELEAAMPGAAVWPSRQRRRLSVPVDMPGFALNRFSVAAWNQLYFRRGAATAGTPRLLPVDPYFFPLDGVAQWNRIYGRSGFLQHQCVVPSEGAHQVLGEILGRIALRGNASFLAVLKTLGSSGGLMSFPMRGFTLALDFPIRAGIFEFLDEIDALVVAAGGRLYLAKDARQSRATFAAGYDNLDAFRRLRRDIGAADRIASRQSERLGI